MSISIAQIKPETAEQLKIFKEFMASLPPYEGISKKNPNTGYLLILSDVNWTANVLDSGQDSFTKDGNKNSKIEFDCNLESGTYSLSYY